MNGTAMHYDAQEASSPGHWSFDIYPNIMLLTYIICETLLQCSLKINLDIKSIWFFTNATNILNIIETSTKLAIHSKNMLGTFKRKSNVFEYNQVTSICTI